MTDEILTQVEGGVGRITLNRPAALHALTMAMCEAMIDALLAWRDDPAVKAVMLDNTGPRGFCSGGDIRMLADSGKVGGDEARAFFFKEYQLNALLMGYPKLTIAILDGIVMGGGVGLALPCKVRVLSERTTFAMPETDIGLFPDVGGGWLLPRLPGKTGMWLALTGARIKAADCMALNIGTHFVPSSEIEALKAAIVGGELDAADRFAGDAGPSPLAATREAIDRLYGQAGVEAIVAALKADGSEWATGQIATLATKSPQALKVTFRQLGLGAKAATFEDNMKIEYRIGARVVVTADFIEGVRSVIVDKDRDPKWSPPTLEDVSEALLDEIFAPLPADQEWTPLP
jgi:enoyl-CoA hydratase